MASIKALSPSLINQIAAGEVVERPSSVVKELVENALDASANEVVIEIVSGGLEAIIVADNGSGMSAEDAKMAWQRHATSKISLPEHLSSISSLGFRGEALASIASVAKCEMETKMRDEISGVFLKIEGGNIIEESECGCPEGTKISVFNLFYNTPARRKYMKSATSEHKKIVELTSEFALAHPEVSFRLVSDGKVAFDVAPSVLEDRIANILGSEVANNLVPVYYGDVGFGVSGFVGKPTLSKSNRNGQFLILNGRVIQNHLLAHAVREAFHSMLMHGKHPWFLIILNVRPEDVDVNVHPRKLEVRFLNQNDAYRTIYKCVSAALDKHILVPKISVSTEPIPMDLRDPRGLKEHVYEKNISDTFAVFQRGDSREQDTDSREWRGTLRAAAQIGSSYILAEDEQGLVIIDQHAAHERVMYDRLMTALRNSKIVSQPVLAPQSVDFSASEAEVLRENLSALLDIGFDIEEFSGNTFIVTAVPADLAKNDAGEILRGVVDDLGNDNRSNSLSDRRENLIHYSACHSAVKFGQKLSIIEQQALLDQLSEIDRCETCPHGRPTMIRMSYDDLEKSFKRKNF